MAYDYRKEARRAARRYGLDPHVFERQINQESGFNPTIRSPAGATGIAQIMPATAKGWGVNPLDPIASLDAAAKNMAGYVRKYGGYENALRAYNAGPGAIQASHGFSETNNYVRTILGGGTPAAGSTFSAAPGSSGSGQQAAPTGLADPGSSGDFTGLLGQLLSKPAPAVQTQAVAPPSFAAHAPTPQGFIAATPEAAPQQAAAPGVDGALSLIGSLRGTDPSDPSQMTGDGQESTPQTTVTRVTQQRAAGAMPSGTAKFDGKVVAAWIAPALEYARAHGWKGSVNSGWRSLADQTRIYNSGVRPAAKPGTSNHEGSDWPRGAIDVSNPEQLSQILKSSPFARELVWAGQKDPVHFSHPNNGSY